LDPDLIAAVDRYVAEHPGTDRSSVIDEAVLLWYARDQDRRVEEQYSGEMSAIEQEELAAWRRIQAAAAARIFGDRELD
jgi:metal-responsive CopG/Arc/MetJ family transcriptional regulator